MRLRPTRAPGTCRRHSESHRSGATSSGANGQCRTCSAVLADRRPYLPRYPWPSTGRIWGANCLYTVETIDGAVWSRVQPAELISHDPLLFRSGNGTAKDSSIVSPGSIQRCRSKIPRTPPSISISTIVGNPFLDLPGIMSAAKTAVPLSSMSILERPMFSTCAVPKDEHAGNGPPWGSPSLFSVRQQRNYVSNATRSTNDGRPVLAKHSGARGRRYRYF